MQSSNYLVTPSFFLSLSLTVFFSFLKKYLDTLKARGQKFLHHVQLFSYVFIVMTVVSMSLYVCLSVCLYSEHACKLLTAGATTNKCNKNKYKNNYEWKSQQEKQTTFTNIHHEKYYLFLFLFLFLFFCSLGVLNSNQNTSSNLWVTTGGGGEGGGEGEGHKSSGTKATLESGFNEMFTGEVFEVDHLEKEDQRPREAHTSAWPRSRRSRNGSETKIMIRTRQGGSEERRRKEQLPARRVAQSVIKMELAQIMQSEMEKKNSNRMGTRVNRT